MAPRSEATYASSRTAHTAASLISLLVVFGALLPESARASVLGDLFGSLKGSLTAHADSKASLKNVQTMALLSPAMNINPAAGVGGGDITIVDGSALMAEEGPSGTIADIERPKVATVSLYVVREGDTLSSIAKLFGVSVGTIRGANDLSAGSQLHVGQKLVILPITGINYTVKKGDTLEGIAKKYGADASEIAAYNGIEGGLVAGATILIPNVDAPAPAASSKPKPSGSSSGVGTTGTAAQIGYYLSPLSRYTKTQGIHGYNGIDLGAPIGTPVLASATGDVVVAREGGYNGGYGSYIVISHGNGSQTLYGHLSKVSVYDGQHVVQGQIIGYVGSTGRSTGSHLHFEIRNGIRNPF